MRKPAKAAAGVSMASTTASVGRHRESRFCVPFYEGILSYVNLWPRGNIVLNDQAMDSSSAALGGSEVSIELRKKITSMYGQHISDDGTSVDYDSLAASDAFAEYCTFASTLNGVDVQAMAHNERVAFFINTYNSLLIHAIISLGAPADLMSRLRLYSRASYREAPPSPSFSRSL